MNILLVEDDQNKRNSILTFIQKTFPKFKIDLALSYRSAVDMIVNQKWDFLLLDMALPTYDITDNEDGFQTEAFAGNRILHEMKRRKILIPTVIITQFETLDLLNSCSNNSRINCSKSSQSIAARLNRSSNPPATSLEAMNLLSSRLMFKTGATGVRLCSCELPTPFRASALAEQADGVLLVSGP